MKNTTFTRLLIAGGLFAGMVASSTGAETSPAKGGAAQLISLHAPNNATASVTIWTAKPSASVVRQVPTAKGGATQLIQLRAPNSPTPAVTVWTGK